MGKFADCPFCQGKGKLQCRDCACGKCKETGMIDSSCARCTSGLVGCGSCSETGKVVVKKGFFGDKFGLCHSGSGSGKIWLAIRRRSGSSIMISVVGPAGATRRLPGTSSSGFRFEYLGVWG